MMLQNPHGQIQLAQEFEPDGLNGLWLSKSHPTLLLSLIARISPTKLSRPRTSIQRDTTRATEWRCHGFLGEIFAPHLQMSTFMKFHNLEGHDGWHLFFLDCHLFVILKRPFKGFWGSRGSSTLRESIQDREFPSVRNLLEVGVQNESHTCLIANTPERKLRQSDLKNITLKHQKESCFRSSGLPPLPTYSRCTYPHVLHDLRGVPLCHHIKRNLQNNTMIRISRVILSLLHLSISLFHPFPRLQCWYNFLIPRLLNPWILVRWVSQNQARKKPQWLTALQHEMPWWSQYFVSLA